MLVVLPVRTAFAHDPPTIAPTQLDFDASSAPKYCNDERSFSNILANWVPRDALRTDADRKLVVRIRRSPKGGKLVDVTHLDAAGATIGEYHERYVAKDECHRVLFDTANAAAELLGAFEEPPPPEPCPKCPPAPPPPEPPPPEPAPSPICPDPLPPPPQVEAPPPIVHRFHLGVGALFGMGATPAQWLGPLVSLGFVLSPRVPLLRIEIDAAYALPVSNAFRGDMISVFGSLCYAPSALRLCGGVVTTFLPSEHDDGDTMLAMLAASMRLGTEFSIAGPVSLRTDAFVIMPFWKQTFGHELAAHDGLNTFAAGGAATAVWSFK